MAQEQDAWTRARKYRDMADQFAARSGSAKDAEVREHYRHIADGYATLADAEERAVLRATKAKRLP